MKKSLLRGAAAASFALALAGGNAEAQSYMPFGPQQNVTLASILSGGWTQCYAAPMAVALSGSAAEVMVPCAGTNLMMAGRATGSDTFMLLAAGAFTAVTQDTGYGNTTNLVNGSEWYFATGYSWGFAPAGAAVSRNSCDTADLGSPLRMCLHNDDYSGGWRIGTAYSLNNSTAYEKVFFTGDGTNGGGTVTPEPVTMTLLGTGLAGVAAARRRRKAKLEV